MRVLMLRLQADGEYAWNAYDDADPLRIADDIAASLNTVGVVKIEIYPG